MHTNVEKKQWEKHLPFQIIMATITVYHRLCGL